MEKKIIFGGRGFKFKLIYYFVKRFLVFVFIFIRNQVRSILVALLHPKLCQYWPLVLISIHRAKFVTFKFGHFSTL
uniref:Uncharacterized protein n=1 Tax=Meloidogyne enterolobii TaxID=390850 RepID=A0A6V7X7I6_MELEN|nr:unnamed protein product [Meloidogyne enterolobii]